MGDHIKVGKIAGLELRAEQSAAIGSVALWAVLSGVAIALLDASPGQAVAGGLLAVLLHWLTVLTHHLGHAWAARRTGYPMTGVRLWGLLGASLYPADEPALPAAVHIRRALGGPGASLLMSLLAAALALALRPVGGLAWWLGAFFFLDNLLIQTLGALLPLGFTDGSTLLTWRGKG